MRGVMNSADRDAWLSALIAAYDSQGTRSFTATSRMLAECERHLRDNARANVAGSGSFH